MKKLIFLLLFPTISLACSGPQSSFPEVPGLDLEMQNLYHCSSYPTSNTTNSNSFTLASDSTNVNYGWFQISGLATVLKTAVAVSPDVVVYASGTAGRIKVLTSAGGQITGMRSANVASVTSTTSTVTCYLNRPAMQGQTT